MKKTMKRWYAILGLVAAALLAVTGCSTLSYAGREETVSEVVRLVNYGEVETLVAQSSLPFVLDGEILFSEGTVSGFWAGFRESGFLLENAVPVVIEEVVPGTSSKFSDSGEMEMFFDTYLVEKAVCVDLETAGGVVYLLLGEKKGDYPEILGFRGPVR